MTLGIAAILIFVLYLIDKHNRWKIAIKIVCWTAAVAIVGVGLVYGWVTYSDYRTRKADEQVAETNRAYEAKMQPLWDCEWRNTSGEDGGLGQGAQYHFPPSTLSADVQKACENNPAFLPPPTDAKPDPFAGIVWTTPRPKSALELHHVRWMPTSQFLTGPDDAQQLRCGDGSGAVIGEIMFSGGTWMVSYASNAWEPAVHGTKEKAKHDVETNAHLDTCTQ